MPKQVLNHWLYPANADARVSERVGLYLANSRPWVSADNTVRRTRLPERARGAERRRRAPRAVRARGRHLRAARALDAAGALPRPVRRAGAAASPPCRTYGTGDNWLGAAERGPVIGRMRDLYAAEVTMTDHWLGMLLDRLHELNLERETVILLVGDHGILLGEHGWTGKISTALYPALTRVPLIVVHPDRRRAGTASDWFASTHDVAPDAPVDGGRAPAWADDRSGPVAAHARPPAARARLRLGRLLRLLLHPLATAGCSGATTSPATSSCSTSAAIPASSTTSPPATPTSCARLYGKVVARAGGRLPWYGGK